MEPKMVFSKNMRALLSSQHKTGREMARALNVDPGAVYAWTNGRALPTNGNISKIAAFLGVTVGTLFSDKLEI